MTTVSRIAPRPLPPIASYEYAEYLNRELSWLRFNDRVLEEAADPGVPLLERLRFLAIFHTNLDEFFMIRVSGLKQQVAAGVEVLSKDGLSPRAQLTHIAEHLTPALAQADAALHDDLLPGLSDHGIRLLDYEDLTAEERKEWDRYYLSQVHPVLTPLAVGPTQRFPFISNLSLNLALWVESPNGERRFARVKVPHGLPRFVVVRGSLDDLEHPVAFLPLERLIAANLHTLFQGMKVGTPWAFRVTRDADVEIREDEANDLMEVLQERLRQRRFGQAVRLELELDTPPDIRETLRAGLALEEVDVFPITGLLGRSDLNRLVSNLDLPELKWKPFVPRMPKVFHGEDIFSVIRSQDVLLHHPFDSFAPVVDFVRQAANDPNVVAIKQTLYRTSGDSPIVKALEEAVLNGKQVAAVIELKARFDEENNIEWARRLEEVGIHVVYGVPGLKTHSKLALVVREEGGDLRRYAHISTGNYNSITARVYTDIGLMTSNPEITADVADVFNRLTGFAQPPTFRRLLVAPRHMKEQLCALIEAEARRAHEGKPAQIIAKCNAITDIDVVHAMGAASQAGVQIDLLVRGICCLVPGRPGKTSNVRVRSVVGRFLEHSRVYWFLNGGDPIVYIGSADLMVRNLQRRVEVLTPVEDPGLKRWLREVYLERYLVDTERTRQMLADGNYVRIRDSRDPDDDGMDVQHTFLQEAEG